MYQQISDKKVDRHYVPNTVLKEKRLYENKRQQLIENKRQQIGVPSTELYENKRQQLIEKCKNSLQGCRVEILRR